MTQTVTAIASTPSVPAALSGARAEAVPASPISFAATSSTSASTASNAVADKSAAAAPEGPPPLTLSVAKADNGVFVYTLTDPSNGAVVAVIPRANVQTTQTGTQVDQKV